MPEISFETPQVPAEIKEIRHPQYKNIYEYVLDNPNLWGTETLLGDWKGEYLLIAKDFYPSSYIEKAIQNDVAQPYRHNPNAATNRNLIKTLTHFGKYSTGTANTNCGFLYTSACFLLRADGVVRGALPDEARVLELSYPVLKFTLEKMSNLKHAVLMGREARRAVEQTQLLGDLIAGKVQVHHVSHPSRAMSDADRFGEWETVFIGTESDDDSQPAQQHPSRVQPSVIGTRDFGLGNKDLVLTNLSTTPRSVQQLMLLTGLSDPQVRGAIGSIRTEYCVWYDARHGFWIDDPLCTSLPIGEGRWRRDYLAS